MIQIFVKTPTVGPVSTHVVVVNNPATTTVKELKELVREKLGNLPLKFGIRTMTSCQMDESMYISHYNIEEMTTLFVLIPFK